MNQSDSSEAVERKKSVAGVFHRASATYDHVGPNFLSYFGRRLVEQAALPPGSGVLDVASGRGAVFFPVAEAVGPNGFVTEIDFAEGMVSETTREIGQRGLANAEIRQMDAEHLDFSESSFEVVLCGFALFFPQLDHNLAEFRRELKPGGRMAVSTWGNQFDQDREWLNNLIKKYLPPKPEADQPPGPAAEPDFRTPEGMEKIFKAAGFVGIRVISEVVDFTYRTKEEWWEELWSHGARAPLERIEKAGGAEALEKFQTEYKVKLIM